MNQGRDFLEHIARHGNLDQLERNALNVVENIRAEIQLMRPPTLKSSARKPLTAVPLQATGLP
jgi:hypothetical protein